MHMLLESFINAGNFIIHIYVIMNQLMIHLNKTIFYIRQYSSSLAKKNVDEVVL